MGNMYAAEYTTITQVSGPLIVVEQVSKFISMVSVEIESGDGEIRRGRVLEAEEAKPLSSRLRHLGPGREVFQGKVSGQGA